MAIYKGSNKIKHVYYRGTEYTSIYLGDLAIFSPTYGITCNLENVTSNAPASVNSGSPLSVVLVPDTGCQQLPWNTKVTMGGEDITSTAYDAATNSINITEVTGDISIEAEAVAEVEYLESNGTPYINTGLYGNIGLDYEIEVQYTGSATSYNVLGDRLTSSSRRYTLMINTSGSYFAYFNAGDSNNQISASNSYRTTSFVKFKKTGLDVYIGNSKIGSFSSQTFTTPNTVLLFAARNNGTVQNPFVGRIKYCKFIINDELVRDFIPVRKDGVGYLYDKVSRQLFGNANSSGTFTYGNDVNAAQSNNLLGGTLLGGSNTPNEPNNDEPIGDEPTNDEPMGDVPTDGNNDEEEM